MQRSSGLKVAARFLAAGFFLMVWAGRATGQANEVVGEYVCAEAQVAGKTVPCRAAALNLKNDGKFELQGEHLVSGNWAELNGMVLKLRAKN
jgi:hypothetical protein